MILGVAIAYVRWCIEYGKKHTHTHTTICNDKTYRYEFGKNILMNESPFQEMVQGVPKSGTRCREQDMGRVVPVSNGFGTTTETFSNTISIPLAIAGSRPRADWLPALSKSYRSLPFFPVKLECREEYRNMVILWDDQFRDDQLVSV